MENSNGKSITLRFEKAVESFIEKVKDDPNVIAVVVSGSFSYDTVWEKSDIDMTVVIRDQKIETGGYCLDEENLTLNAKLIQRSDFKRFLEKQKGGSFNHSYMAKGKIVYSKEDSLYEYYEDFKKIGKADMETTIFFSCGELVGYMHKAEKWLVIKDDITYSRFYILKAAEVIARIEVCKHLEIPTREAVLQATRLNPSLMQKFYERPMAGPLTKEELFAYIRDIDDYILSNIEAVMNVTKDCLGDGEVKTVTQISKYYKTDSHFIVGIFEYLYEKGFVEKLSETIRITPKSKMAVEEIAFLWSPMEA